MSTRARSIAFGLLVLLALVFALAVFAPPERARLANGTTVTLRSIHYGNDDRWMPGTTFERLARRFVPRKFLLRFGLRPLNTTYKENFLFVCLDLEGPPPNRPYVFSITDENDLESARLFTDRTFLDRTNGHHLIAFKLANPPSHSKRLRVNLYETAMTNVVHVATLRAKNPAFVGTKFPPPPPLPQTVREGGVDFTLLAVNTGLHGTGSVDLAGTYWTEFIFRVGTNEPGALGTNERGYGAWSIKAISATSLAGRRLDDTHLLGRIGWQRGPTHMSRLDDGVVNLRGSLWPELPWKIHAEFTPSAVADLPPEAFVTFRGVPVPPPGQTNALNVSTQVFNKTLQITSIRSRLLPSSGGSSNRVIVSANVQFTGPGAETVRIRRIVDDRGKEVVSSPRMLMPSFPSSVFGVDPGVTSVDFIFGVARVYSVDFVAQSTVLRTNIAHW
jgi:hypothetical protein